MRKRGTETEREIMRIKKEGGETVANREEGRNEQTRGGWEWTDRVEGELSQPV